MYWDQEIDRARKRPTTYNFCVQVPGLRILQCVNTSDKSEWVLSVDLVADCNLVLWFVGLVANYCGAIVARIRCID